MIVVRIGWWYNVEKIGKKIMESWCEEMGRTILCPHCRSTFDEDILKEKHSENVCLVCGGNLNGGGEDSKEEWVTWYYYGFKNSSNYCLHDKPIDLEKRGDIYYLIKEFKAPPKDADGNCDAAKRELSKYVPDAFAPPKETPIFCPKCGSTEYTLMNRGFSIWTGFLGSGKVKRVCNRCKREF